MSRWLPALVGLGGAGLLAAAALRSGWRRRPVDGPLTVIGDSIAVGTGHALERAGAAVDLQAQEGEGLAAFISWLDERLELVGTGETVVVSIGTNSIGGYEPAELIRRVQEQVDAIRARGIRVVLIGPPPALGYHRAQSDPEWADRLRRAAVLYGHVREEIDLWALLGDPRRAGYYAAGLGAPDGLHPNRAGYDRIARAILEGER